MKYNLSAKYFFSKTDTANVAVMHNPAVKAYPKLMFTLLKTYIPKLITSVCVR